MFKFIKLFKTKIILFSIYLFSLPTFAALPKPPSELNIGDGNFANGVIKYGLNIMGYGCYLLAGLAFLFIGYEMIAAYQEAKRMEKLSHFFTWSLVGVFTLAVCLGLLYSGNKLITS